MLVGEKDWDNTAETWVDFVREGKDYHRDELNNPATFKLIGNVKGKAVLDLACGEGYNTRILVRQGAEAVGIDFSEKMIEFAKKEEEKGRLGIHYYVMDAADLNGFPDDHFDLVTCFMSLQDIRNYKKAISEAARVLKNRSRFVFSIPHPCFENIVVRGKRTNVSKRCFGEIKYLLPWGMERLTKPSRTATFHRTLTDYADALYMSRLLVSRLVEPRSTHEGLLKYPHLRRHMATPQSIIVESVKCGDELLTLGGRNRRFRGWYFPWWMHRCRRVHSGNRFNSHLTVQSISMSGRL
jgi:SAM-dependent methyltransferase